DDPVAQGPAGPCQPGGPRSPTSPSLASPLRGLPSLESKRRHSQPAPACDIHQQQRNLVKGCGPHSQGHAAPRTCSV
ncbi:unnamed protein product, partial [Gulo gulo]